MQVERLRNTKTRWGRGLAFEISGVPEAGDAAESVVEFLVTDADGGPLQNVSGDGRRDGDGLSGIGVMNNLPEGSSPARAVVTLTRWSTGAASLALEVRAVGPATSCPAPLDTSLLDGVTITGCWTYTAEGRDGGLEVRSVLAIQASEGAPVVVDGDAQLIFAPSDGSDEERLSEETGYARIPAGGTGTVRFGPWELVAGRAGSAMFVASLRAKRFLASHPLGEHPIEVSDPPPGLSGRLARSGRGLDWDLAIRGVETDPPPRVRLLLRDPSGVACFEHDESDPSADGGTISLQGGHVNPDLPPGELVGEVAIAPTRRARTSLEGEVPPALGRRLLRDEPEDVGGLLVIERAYAERVQWADVRGGVVLVLRNPTDARVEVSLQLRPAGRRHGIHTTVALEAGVVNEISLNDDPPAPGFLLELEAVQEGPSRTMPQRLPVASGEG